VTVIGASGVGRRLRRRRLRHWIQHTPPPAASTTPRPPASTPLPPPLEVPPLVVIPAGVAESPAGVVVRCGIDGATAPCREEAAVGAGGVTEADADASGVAEAAGSEAEGEEAVAEREGGAGEDEGGVGVGDCP
jgi:hypothetical protein